MILLLKMVVGLTIISLLDGVFAADLDGCFSKAQNAGGEVTVPTECMSTIIKEKKYVQFVTDDGDLKIYGRKNIVLMDEVIRDLNGKIIVSGK